MAETTYPLNRTGLIVVDATNDFISEGGKLWGAVEDVVTQVGVVPNMARAVAAARLAVPCTVSRRVRDAVPVPVGPEDFAQRIRRPGERRWHAIWVTSDIPR